jgi:type II secretory ATPase GspE/PulE/Tfp pilus assembly ATPase PilB-like protein
LEEGHWIHRHLAQAPTEALLLGMKQEVWSVGKAHGCDHCFGTGYRGSVVISEIVFSTPTLKQLIALQGLNRHAFQRELSAQHALTIQQDLAIALAQGETTPDMVWRTLPASLLSTT